MIGLPISRKKDLSLSRGGFRYGESKFEVKNDEKQAPEVKNEKKLEIQNVETTRIVFGKNIEVRTHGLCNS